MQSLEAGVLYVLEYYVTKMILYLWCRWSLLRLLLYWLLYRLLHRLHLALTLVHTSLEDGHIADVDDRSREQRERSKRSNASAADARFEPTASSLLCVTVACTFGVDAVWTASAASCCCAGLSITVNYL